MSGGFNYTQIQTDDYIDATYKLESIGYEVYMVKFNTGVLPKYRWTVFCRKSLLNSTKQSSGAIPRRP